MVVINGKVTKKSNIANSELSDLCMTTGDRIFCAISEIQHDGGHLILLRYMPLGRQWNPYISGCVLGKFAHNNLTYQLRLIYQRVDIDISVGYWIVIANCCAGNQRFIINNHIGPTYNQSLYLSTKSKNWEQYWLWNSYFSIVYLKTYTYYSLFHWSPNCHPP